MINIFLLNDDSNGFIWSAEEWNIMRKNHRIVGTLIGSLPSFPRQDIYCGLPVMLLPEEVTLLKEFNFARVVQCPSLLQPPDEKTKALFLEQEKIINETIKEAYLEKRKTIIEQKFDAIVKGKKKRNPNITEADKQAIINEEMEKAKAQCEQNTRVVVSTADLLISEEDLIDVEWTYPETEKEKLRYEVFKDFWSKKCYITCGAKFGGDFLCYGGDPFLYHATYIVLCKTNESRISCKDIVSHGRIGTCTRKVVVIASKDFENENSPLVYQSLEWLENKRFENLRD